MTDPRIKYDEKACLYYDPLYGDFDTDIRVLSDKTVTAKKERPCDWHRHCGETIKAGDRVRVMTVADDGGVYTYTWCEKCCADMAHATLTGEITW